jgi:hypothetical protein
MNYLTNYYKTLSEELQHKLNILEAYAQNLSEDLTAGGGVMQGPGSTSVSTTSNTTQNNGGDDSELQALLNAWGTNDPRFDFNQDGVVDGDDLGVALARMLPSGNSPQIAEPTFAATNANRPGSISRSRVSALDQAGVENMSGAGANFGNGGVNPPRKPKPGPNVSVQDISGKINSPGYNTGSGTPPRGPKPPVSGPGVSVQDVNGRINSPGFNTGSGMPPRTPKPPVSGPGVSVQDESGRINSPGFDVGVGGGIGIGGNPRKPNPPTNIRTRNVNFNSSNNAADLTSYISNSETNPTSLSAEEQEMGGIPYWMSGRTTQTDSSFRGMQRRKRN